MSKTIWKKTWWGGDRTLTTAEAGEYEMCSDADGHVERAAGTAESVACALGRLVETLHEKGLLTVDEVRHVLDLYGYDVEM